MRYLFLYSSFCGLATDFVLVMLRQSRCWMDLLDCRGVGWVAPCKRRFGCSLLV